MANKKLKVEVELETAKAKQQLGRMGDGVGVSSPTPSTRSADKLAEATTLNTRQMMSMTRAFSGMALGLAASYSARYFDQGSMAEKALGYGGAALSGASMGAMVGRMAGPWGMAGGALLGGGIAVGKEYLDRDKAKTDALDAFREAESVLEMNEEFEAMMKRITSPFSGESLTVRLARLSDEYLNEIEMISNLKKLVEEQIGDGDLKGAKETEAELARSRQRKNAIMSVAEKMDNADNGPSRASMIATDALMKLGGGFGLPQNGSVGTVEVLKDGIAVTNRLLEDIRANTLKKGTTWL